MKTVVVEEQVTRKNTPSVSIDGLKGLVVFGGVSKEAYTISYSPLNSDLYCPLLDRLK